MAVYPNLYAGMRADADLLTSMLPIHAAKSVDTPRASTTTIIADPELQVAVEANADYMFEMMIRYSGLNTADMSVIIAGPSGSSGVWGGNFISPLSETSAEGTKSSIRTPIGSQRDIACISTSTSMIIMISGRLKTAATAGTFSFNWAQQTSNATSTVVSADSWLMLKRIA
jgi:hypothetical protein